MSYQYILFDLDGTLTDPGIGITNSVMYALRKFDIEVSDRSELFPFIGPPLSESFSNYYGFSKEQSDAAVAFYREYFKDTGIFENTIYDGIDDLLNELSREGRTLILATSKPAVFARRILEHFKLDRYFSFVAGSELDGTRVHKYDVIVYALEQCGIRDLTKCLMIGDRKHDVFGAKSAGISSLGVLYGYGSRQELENAGADYIAETVYELKKLFVTKEI